MNKKDQIFQSEDVYLKWLRESKGLSKTTVYHYYTYYKDFVKMDLDQKNINKYLQQRKNNKVARGFMKSYLEFHKVNKEFDLPPKPTGRIKKRIIRDFNPHQLERVRAYSYKQSLRDGLMFDILYHGALRLDEILSIKINSFEWHTYFKDPTKHIKLIVLGKGKKHRPVLIPPETINKLLDHYFKTKVISVGMNSDFISDKLMAMPNLLFHKLYSKRVWINLKRNSERSIGIAIRPHELRHTRATALEKAGASIRSIQIYLGHSNPQTTEIYLHTTQKASLENIQKVVGD